MPVIRVECRSFAPDVAVAELRVRATAAASVSACVS
jgi:hypothetical protein